MTRVEVITEMERLLEKLKNGCSNSGCSINKTKGIKTNAICRCNPRNFANQLKYLYEEIENTYKLGGPWK